MPTPRKYKLSFTGVYLQYSACLKLAELYEQYQDWDAVRQRAQAQRLLQGKREATDQKRLGVLTRRLATLHEAEWEYFFDTGPESRRQLVWMATLRYHPLIAEFVAEVIREKFLVFDNLLLISAFERFWEHKAEQSAQLDGVTSTTQRKIRNVIFRMLEEAGWIQGNRQEGYQITPPWPAEGLIRAVVTNHPAWLKMFLMSDQDIAFYQKKYAEED